MSKLEERILDALDAIGYDGPMLKKPTFPIAIEGGPKNLEFTQLVNFLTNEIRNLLDIDEEVNAIKSPEDSVEFIMEITSFLKELNCPYGVLLHGHVSDRLQNISDRLLLLDYLINEVMTARILQERKPEKKIELKIQETPEGKDMRLILQTLKFPKPPPNISIDTLFQKLIPTIPIVLNKAGKDIVGPGIFKGFLSEKQWQILQGVNEDLNKEYRIRREMLLTRLDCTIQSFQWSDKTRGKDDLFEKIYHEKRKLLHVEPEVDLADLLAARSDIAIIEKTSNSSVRKNTKTHVTKVIIGMVPDRGGRTSEIAPPPPEMPPWQQRNAGQGGRGGGRGGGFQSRGGGGNFQSRGGGNQYSGGGNQYSSGGGNQYSSGGGYQSNQSQRGGYDSNRSFDSAGSYSSRGSYDKSNYDNRGSYDNRGGGGGGGGRDSYNNRGGGRDNYDSRGGGRDNYDNRGGGRDYDNRSYDNRTRDSYDKNRSFDNQSSGGYERRDSGGSYGSQDYQQSKRVKTYDSFQASKTTYADQYVQEGQHNQQYSSRGDSGRGGGRSNYQRGGRGGGYR